jgi:hypothetical protein
VKLSGVLQLLSRSRYCLLNKVCKSISFHVWILQRAGVFQAGWPLEDLLAGDADGVIGSPAAHALPECGGASREASPKKLLKKQCRPTHLSSHKLFSVCTSTCQKAAEATELRDRSHPALGINPRVPWRTRSRCFRTTRHEKRYLRMRGMSRLLGEGGEERY